MIEKINNEIKELKEKLNNVKGTKTEVYARIVGYFRAVDSWNVGKKDEYMQRKVFKIKENDIKIKQIDTKIEKIEENTDIKANNYILFTTTFCRNCPQVKEYVKNNIKIPGKEIDVSNDLDIAKKYNIMSVPTIIFFNNDIIVFEAHNIEDIKKFMLKI
jgi:hypothetical protein